MTLMLCFYGGVAFTALTWTALNQPPPRCSCPPQRPAVARADHPAAVRLGDRSMSLQTLFGIICIAFGTAGLVYLWVHPGWLRR